MHEFAPSLMLSRTKEVPLNRWILVLVIACASVSIVGCNHHKKDDDDVNIKVKDDTGSTSSIKVDKK
jgi:hypothetical protein